MRCKRNAIAKAARTWLLVANEAQEQEALANCLSGDMSSQLGNDIKSFFREMIRRNEQRVREVETHVGATPPQNRFAQDKNMGVLVECEAWIAQYPEMWQRPTAEGRDMMLRALATLRMLQDACGEAVAQRVLFKHERERYYNVSRMTEATGKKLANVLTNGSDVNDLEGLD